MNKRIMFLLVFFILLVFCSGAQAVELFNTGKVNIHGFISQGYLFSDENNFFADTEDDGSFQYSEAGVNFSCDVSERLNLGLQLLSRDLGQMGNNELTIDWAYADFSFYDWLKLKAGKIKIPYGLYNTERDVDMLRTFVFLPQSVYYEGWRDSVNALTGVGFYGYIGAGVLGSFRYDAYMGNSIVKPDGGVARMLKDKVPPAMDLEFSEINVQYTNAGSLTWESLFGLDGLRIVGSTWDVKFDAEGEFNYGVATESTFHVRCLTSALSMEYAHNNLVFATEVMQNEYDLVLDGTAIDKHFKTLGWYSSLTYRFMDWFELGTYYSEYYANKNDKDGKKALAEGSVTQAHQEYLKDLCLTARFDITANWVFKLEGHKMEGASLLYSYDGNVNDAGVADYEKDWYLGAAKLTFSF